MKTSGLIILISVFLFINLLSCSKPSPVHISDPVEVTTSNHSALNFIIKTPPFQKVTKIVIGNDFQELSIPGFGHIHHPGHPMVPVTGRWILVPPGKSYEFHVKSSRPITYQEFRIIPAPRPTFEYRDGVPHYKGKEFYLDQKVFSGECPYPESLVKVTRDGILRGEHLIYLELHPVQYYPQTGEIRWYPELEVEVDFVTTSEIKSFHLKNIQNNQADLTEPFYNLLDTLVLNSNLLESEISSSPSNKPRPGSITPEASPGPTSPRFKIEVDEDRIYILTGSDLENAGISLQDLDPRNLKITNHGYEIAVYIKGEDDGILDGKERIFFYGQKNRGKFTDVNVYWLSLEESPGLRMETQDGTISGGGSVPQSFIHALHVEENHLYFPNPAQGEDVDHWYWENFIAPGTREYEFEITGLADVMDDALVRVDMYGASYISDIDPDHHVTNSLNGISLRDEYWDDQLPYTAEYLFPQASILREGTNVLSLYMPGDTGASIETLFPNWFEIEYRHTYIAIEDFLRFSPDPVLAGVAHEFNLDGFLQEDIYVFNITAPEYPARITPVVIEPDGMDYAARFEDRFPNSQTYIALTPSSMKVPLRIFEDESSNLRNPGNQADYIIITHKSLYDSIFPLAEKRIESGLNAMIIRIQDVYDEFSDGIFDPQAIKDFLTYAYFHWSPPAPTYVLLVGDATYDYHGYLGNDLENGGNMVPTHLLQTGYNGDTASDNWFVCVDGNDPLPDMFVGRFPAETPEQVENIVNKIIEYEEAEVWEPWQRNMLMVADDGFEVDARELSNNFMSPLCEISIDLTEYPNAMSDPDPVTLDILDAMNSGGGIVTYVGHGGHENWTHESVFRYLDIYDLADNGWYFFFIGLTCLNGFFDNANSNRIMVQGFNDIPNAGGIGSIAATRSGSAAENIIFGKGFFQALIEDDIREVGTLATQAKLFLYQTNSSFIDSIEMYTLFTDPALNLRVPYTGDINVSGRVDGVDLIYFSMAQGSSPGDSNWNNDADINRDGVIDQNDLNLLTARFGRKNP